MVVLAAGRAVARLCPLAHDARCIRRAVSRVAPAVPVDAQASVVLADLVQALAHDPDSVDLVREERLGCYLREEEKLQPDVRLDAPHSVVEVASAMKRAKKAR